MIGACDEFERKRDVNNENSIPVYAIFNKIHPQF